MTTVYLESGNFNRGLVAFDVGADDDFNDITKAEGVIQDDINFFVFDLEEGEELDQDYTRRFFTLDDDGERDEEVLIFMSDDADVRRKKLENFYSL